MNSICLYDACENYSEQLRSQQRNPPPRTTGEDLDLVIEPLSRSRKNVRGGICELEYPISHFERAITKCRASCDRAKDVDNEDIDEIDTGRIHH